MNLVEKDLVVNQVLSYLKIRDRDEDNIRLVLEDLEYWEIVESLIESLDVLKFRGVSINDPT